MKKSKEKKIKKLKKVHVWPHILMFLLFVGFVSVTTNAFTKSLVSYMVENHLEGEYQQVRSIATQIAEQNAGKDLITVVPKKTSGDFAIYDHFQGEFVEKAQRSINMTGLIPFRMLDRTVYFDEAKGLGASIIVDVKKLEQNEEALRQADLEAFEKSIESGTGMMYLHAWIEQPLMGGRYSLFYSADVDMSAREMLFVFGTTGMIFMMVAVPLFLYIITVIISLVDQSRAAGLLYYDAITGGKNWLYFREQVERLLKKNKRGKRKYVMVSLRMERYQSYCACYGASEGEEVVEKIHLTLCGAVRKKKEVFARYSEAEFCLFLLMTDRQQAYERVEEIRKQLTRNLEPRKIDFSIGLCEAAAGDNMDSLFSNASLARKTVISGAAERILWFDEKLKEAQIWEHFVEDNMERALAEGELFVYLQPKYNAETHRLGGAEALIRWISPTKGFIGPGKFIPIFEKNGFITKIDDFMLSSVAKLQAKWVQEGQNVVPVSVNISRAHFTQEYLAEHICRIVEEAGAPKELIELELTESAFFEDKEMLISTVEKLKAMGFSISMDDFGAGYSSLNSLKDLHLDVLKIDADFFRGKEENEERGSLIVTETIQLAKSLGMTTVAEGIESADQVEFLAKSGCDLIQGFYFAKPMPVEDYVKKMEEDREKNL